MSQKKENPKTKLQQEPSLVINFPSSECLAEDCHKKGTRAGFCPEHYLWFKSGLINKYGKRPKDFDKKYQSYIKKAA